MGQETISKEGSQTRLRQKERKGLWMALILPFLQFSNLTCIWSSLFMASGLFVSCVYLDGGWGVESDLLTLGAHAQRGLQ